MSVYVLATICNVSCAVTLVAICRYDVWVGRLQSGGSPRQLTVCIPPYTSFVQVLSLCQQCCCQWFKHMPVFLGPDLASYTRPG